MDNYKYEFQDWSDTLDGRLPVNVVASSGGYVNYEMSQGTIFELDDGKFLVAIEEGCS